MILKAEDDNFKSIVSNMNDVTLRDQAKEVHNLILSLTHGNFGKYRLSDVYLEDVRFWRGHEKCLLRYQVKIHEEMNYRGIGNNNLLNKDREVLVDYLLRGGKSSNSFPTC